MRMLDLYAHDVLDGTRSREGEVLIKAAALPWQVSGSTPLHLAVLQRRKDLIESLLLAGANPLLRNVSASSCGCASDHSESTDACA